MLNVSLKLEVSVEGMSVSKFTQNYNYNKYQPLDGYLLIDKDRDKLPAG